MCLAHFYNLLTDHRRCKKDRHNQAVPLFRPLAQSWNPEIGCRPIVSSATRSRTPVQGTQQKTRVCAQANMSEKIQHEVVEHWWCLGGLGKSLPFFQPISLLSTNTGMKLGQEASEWHRRSPKSLSAKEIDDRDTREPWFACRGQARCPALVALRINQIQDNKNWETNTKYCVDSFTPKCYQAWNHSQKYFIKLTFQDNLPSNQNLSATNGRRIQVRPCKTSFIPTRAPQPHCRNLNTMYIFAI